MDKRAQSWTTDFMVSLLLFSIAIVIFSRMITNSSYLDDKDTKELLWDAEQVTNFLMTEGEPANWNSTTVQKIGIRTDYKLDLNKTTQLQNIEYYKAKALFGIKSDYFIFFQRKDGTNIDINGEYGIGFAGVNATQTEINMDNINPESLSQITRIIMHDEEIIKMAAYVWR